MRGRHFHLPRSYRGRRQPGRNDLQVFCRRRSHLFIGKPLNTSTLEILTYSSYNVHFFKIVITLSGFHLFFQSNRSIMSRWSRKSWSWPTNSGRTASDVSSVTYTSPLMTSLRSHLTAEPLLLPSFLTPTEMPGEILQIFSENSYA
jgi:hypothetical protein